MRSCHIRHRSPVLSGIVAVTFTAFATIAYADPYADAVDETLTNINDASCGEGANCQGDPSLALGAQDWAPGMGNVVSLGNEGTLGLIFIDERCIVDDNTVTPDIIIYEGGGIQTEDFSVDAARVGEALAGNPVDSIQVEGMNQPARALDLTAVIGGSGQIDRVQIIDIDNDDDPQDPLPGQEPATGADIDAAECIASRLPINPIETFTIPNVGGTVNGEAVIFGERGEDGAVAVIDAGNGTVMNDVNFTAGLTPIDAAYGTDLNGDGDGEIYALLWDDSALLPKVEARDPLTGTKRKNINYSESHEPIAFSATGQQHEEGVVLARQTNSDDRGRLLIRNLISRKTRVNINLPKAFQVEGLVMAPDFSGNGFDEALVSAARFSDEKGFILIYDTGVARNGRIRNIPIPSGQAIISHDYTLGPGAVSAVTALVLRTSDNRPRLYLFDALTGDRLWVKGIKTTWDPRAVKAFETSGGGRRIAALFQRSTDGRPLVAIYNANNGKELETVLFKKGQTGVDLTIFPDTTLDSGKQPELGVTMDNGTVRIRDSLTKQLLQTLHTP